MKNLIERIPKNKWINEYLNFVSLQYKFSNVSSDNKNDNYGSAEICWFIIWLING